MSNKRFYAPGITADLENYELDEIQSSHLRTVLRLDVGDKIALFDGEGAEFQCEVLSIKRNSVNTEIEKEITPSSPESPLNLVLGVPLIKPANSDLIVRKAVELGVRKVVPIATEFCGKHAKRFNPERWEKLVIESSKQCGRAKLMEVGERQKFEEFAWTSTGTRLIFDAREGKSLPDFIENNHITAAFGPEGGWSDKEIELARKHGFVVVRFGGRILRAETAAITIAGILQHRFGDMG